MEQCSHPNVEMKHDLDQGGYYIFCPECGSHGTPAPEEDEARKNWGIDLRAAKYREAEREAREKKIMAMMSESISGASLGPQLEVARAQVAALEKIAKALERIAEVYERAPRR